MSKHTPGPWRVCAAEDAHVNHIRIGPVIVVAASLNDDEGDICMIDSLVGTAPHAIANARLIAAAPEMREKIEGALREWDILPRDRAFSLAEITDWLTRYMAPAMDDLRTAIAKAEGQS